MRRSTVLVIPLQLMFLAYTPVYILAIIRNDTQLKETPFPSLINYRTSLII